MVNDVADAIAKQSVEIFKQLDKLQGGIAEIKQSSKVP